MKKPFIPRIKLFLAPIMDRQARESFHHIDSNLHNPAWLKEYGPFYVLAIVRSVVATKTPPNLRVRMGLMMLMNLLDVTPQQALNAINNPYYLRRVVLKPGDQPELVAAIQNHVKWLDNQMSTGSLVHNLNARAYRESQEQLFKSEQQRKQRRLIEHEMRRIREKARLLAERQAEEERLRLIMLRLQEENKKQQDKRPKRPMRWLA